MVVTKGNFEGGTIWAKIVWAFLRCKIKRLMKLKNLPRFIPFSKPKKSKLWRPLLSLLSDILCCSSDATISINKWKVWKLLVKHVSLKLPRICKQTSTIIYFWRLVVDQSLAPLHFWVLRTFGFYCNLYLQFILYINLWNKPDQMRPFSNF